jgi:hypothetical protein
VVYIVPQAKEDNALKYVAIVFFHIVPDLLLTYHSAILNHVTYSVQKEETKINMHDLGRMREVVGIRILGDYTLIFLDRL